MAEDQAQGEDAAFTVNVDGQQIGGLQTARAAQSSGQTEEFTFNGDWAPGSHDVTVTFANNFIYPGQSGDRNLYVDGVTYNGQTISDSKTGIYQSPLFPPNSTNGNNFGNAVFRVNDTTSIPSGAGPTQTTSPGAVSVGSGADTLKLGMAEDAYQGDAQFTVSVDGKQIGGTLTTTALITHGQSQEFDIHGDFGSGGHSVSISFVNDRIGDFYPAGTPGLPPQGQWAVDTTDRNLYVTGVTLNGGAPASGTPWEFSSDGSKDFWVTAGSGSDSGSGTSDNASVSSSSLDAGSSSAGLSFIASSDTTDTRQAMPRQAIPRRGIAP
jgi:predicted xylan-binding protein with Ca-dependent carbohydrate-binding module